MGNHTVQKEIPSKCETDSFGQHMTYEYTHHPISGSDPRLLIMEYFENSDACKAGVDHAYVVRATNDYACVNNEDSYGTSTSYEQNKDGLSVCEGYKHNDCTYENWQDVTCKTYDNCDQAFTNDEFGEHYISVVPSEHVAQLEKLHDPDCYWFWGSLYNPTCD